MDKVIDAIVGRAKERTAIANLYRQNACMRHGIPYEECTDEMCVQVEHQHTHNHTGLEKERQAVEGLTEAVKAEKAKPVEVPVVVEKEVIVEKDRDPRKEEFREAALPKFPGWLKKGLIAVSLLGGGAGGTMLTNYFISDPPATELKDGSLLQYLEDKGEHLSEGGFEK